MSDWNVQSVKSGITVFADPGLDDLLALALIERLTPGVPKTLIPSFGNIPVEVAYQNARDFLRVSDDTWKIMMPRAKSQMSSANRDWIDGDQGANGLWDIRPADNKTSINKTDIVDNKNLIALAPLTEVKELLVRQDVKQMLIMGGVFERFAENGNKAELNIRLDAEAARWVFENVADGTTTLVPADVAFDVTWSRTKVESIPETTLRNEWFKRMLLAGYDNGRYTSGNELYDPLAVFLAWYPGQTTWRLSGIEVLGGAGADGQTIYSASNPGCAIALRVKNPQLVANELFKLIFEDN